MNSEEIDLLLKKNLSDDKEYFGGVFASDTLPNPKKITKLSAFVVNIDPSTKAGSHWVGIIINPLQENIYFDSYGYKPFVKSIQDFLGDRYIFNEQQLQHPLSTTCGEWCIFFILCYLNKHNLSCIKDYFKNSPDLLLNDYAVNKFVNRIGGMKKRVINKQFLKSQIAKQMKENVKEFVK